MPLKRNKYRQSFSPIARLKRTFDNIEFGSIVEMARYRDHLKILLGCNQIAELKVQQPYELVVNGMIVGKYTADFVYRDLMTGQKVVEEIKGDKGYERDFPLRWNLMQALHPEYSYLLLKGRQVGTSKFVFFSIKKCPRKVKPPKL